MPDQVRVKPRSRAGSFRSFVDRYEPIPNSNDELIRPWDDPSIIAFHGRGRETGHCYVWTLVEGDNGQSYFVPGFATVNYLGRVLCTNPWSDIEEGNPGYLW